MHYEMGIRKLTPHFQDYPSNTVPNKVEHLFMAQLFHDRKQREARSQLSSLLTRWEQYVRDGVFALSVPLETKLGEKNEMYDFWTAPNPYWDMSVKAPELFESLKQSGLVIFKVC